MGLAICRAATLRGWRVALVEQEAHLCEWASGSNSGIVCTGVDAEPGTLERALIRDAISQMRPYLSEMNIPHRACGSLVCTWPWDEQDSSSLSRDQETPGTSDPLDHVLQQSTKAGDTQASKLSKSQVLEWEPHLNPEIRGAVHIPGEIVVDPWLYSISLAVHARENGAQIFTNFPVDPASIQWKGDSWTVSRRQSFAHSDQGACERASSSSPSSASTPSQISARCIANATGLWSSDFQHCALQAPVTWTARPRRGQYRIYEPTTRNSPAARTEAEDPSCSTSFSLSRPIQPVPTPRTKGIFVFSTIYNHIVAGPTATDQESKTDRTVDKTVAQQLDAHIQRVLPHIHPQESCVAEYVGIRPGTNRRDYQIIVGPDTRHPWISVAGIRSTGLTASLGIGRHVCQLMETLQWTLRFSNASPSSTTTTVTTNDPKKICTTPLPPVQHLIADFQTRGNGMVEIHGNLYKVTHPLTRIGWERSSNVRNV